jgi:hypothetical protein
MSYEVGSQYRSTLTVQDATGNLVDPASQVITVTLPDQTTATPAIVRDSLGTFHADYTFAEEGLHKFFWSTVSPVTARTDYANAAMWRSVIGIDEAKNFINDEDAGSDPILRNILAAATELAEDIVGVCVPKRFVNERITSGSSYQQVIRLPHAPLLNDTSVESIVSVWPGGPSWTTDQLITYPDSATVEVSSLWLPFWFGPWKATYTAGRMVIPEAIQQGIKEIVYDLWSIHRPYATGDLEPGPEDTARFEQMLTTYTMPPHAKALLSPKEQPGFA